MTTEAEYIDRFRELRNQSFWRAQSNEFLRLVAAVSLVSGGGGGGIVGGATETTLAAALAILEGIEINTIEQNIRALTASDVVTANLGDLNGAATTANQVNGLQITQLTHSRNPTYAATINTNLIASATDVFGLTGSATKIIKVTKVAVNFVGPGVLRLPIFMVKRSTPNTGGTLTTLTPTSYDSVNPVATALARLYTANPTALGTSLGNALATRYVVPTTTTTVDEAQDLYQFGNGATQPVILRGVNESLWLNLNAAAAAGTNLIAYIEWSET